MKKKHIIWIVTLVVICLIAVAGFYFLNQNQKQDNEEQKAIFEEQIATINTLTEIDMTIHSKGSYGKVERQIKEDMKECYEHLKILGQAYNNKTITNTFSSSNLKEDGPEFEKTKQAINEVRRTIHQEEQNLEKLLSYDAIEEKAKKLKVNNTFKGIYKEKLTSFDYSEKGLEGIKENNQRFLAYLDKIEEILNYLQQNKEQWEIKDNILTYKNNSFIIKYQELTKELKELQ